MKEWITDAFKVVPDRLGCSLSAQHLPSRCNGLSWFSSTAKPKERKARRKEGREKGQRRKRVVEIHGELGRLQSDTHKVKITVESPIFLWSSFFFVGFSLFSKSCNLNLRHMKHPCPHTSHASYYFKLGIPVFWQTSISSINITHLH